MTTRSHLIDSARIERCGDPQMFRPSHDAFSTKGRGHRGWLRTCSEPGMKGKGRLMTSRHSILVFSLALLTTFLAANLRGGAQNDALDLVDAKGNIRKPADYRDRYHALGVY